MTRAKLVPDAGHPITVKRTERRVVVRVGDQVIADSADALTLQESTYPPVQYIPLADVDPTALRRTESTTYCPYKGDASYYSVIASTGEVTDAVWIYEDPYPAVAEIVGHVAFYPNQVDITVADEAADLTRR
jgi:uncharacterized protein (DUF427 family)